MTFTSGRLTLRRTLLRRFCTLQLTWPGPAEISPPDAAESGVGVAAGREGHSRSGPGDLRAVPLGEPFDKRALHG